MILNQLIFLTIIRKMSWIFLWYTKTFSATCYQNKNIPPTKNNSKHEFNYFNFNNNPTHSATWCSTTIWIHITFSNKILKIIWKNITRIIFKRKYNISEKWKKWLFTPRFMKDLSRPHDKTLYPYTINQLLYHFLVI